MFEYDPEKSQRNQSKHGINFEQAQLQLVASVVENGYEGFVLD